MKIIYNPLVFKSGSPQELEFIISPWVSFIGRGYWSLLTSTAANLVTVIAALAPSCIHRAVVRRGVKEDQLALRRLKHLLNRKSLVFNVVQYDSGDVVTHLMLVGLILQVSLRSLAVQYRLTNHQCRAVRCYSNLLGHLVLVLQQLRELVKPTNVSFVGKHLIKA